MNEDRFWTIVETCRSTSTSDGEKRLRDALRDLAEEELLEFDRISTLKATELSTSSLWGVAYLALGGCSDDGFTDWLYWLLHQGREAFEIGRDRPDDLVPIIDAHDDPGEVDLRIVTPAALLQVQAQLRVRGMESEALLRTTSQREVPLAS